MNCIREVRKKHGLTQQQLAERLGVAQSSICQWETGVASPTIQMVEQIAKVLNGRISELFGEKTPSCPRDTSTELVVTCKDVDSDIGRERGWRDVWYRCPGCGVVIATESWDRVYCFGSGSIMKDNHIPAFCPECGQKIIKKRWKP